jgi:thiol-disulfide isomerase/thioredoxin
MGQTIFPAFCLLLILFFGHCAPSRSSFFGELDWQAVDMDGNPVVISSLDKELIALNVYSPDCVPCWKEIPALNFLASEIKQKHANRALYMVVDPYQIVPDLPRTVSWGEAFGKGKIRMEKEIKDRKINVPILFMKPPFEVKEDFLVTGTPETLLLETKPLRLYYNFIGAISEESNIEEIKKDSKVNFFRHQFGMIAL